MPDKKPVSVYQRLTSIRAAINNAITMIEDYEHKSDELNRLLAALRSAMGVMDLSLGGEGFLSQGALPNIIRAADTALKAYQRSFAGLSRADRKREEPIMKAAADAVTYFILPEAGAAAHIARLQEMGSREQENYRSDSGSDLLMSFRAPHSISGTKQNIRVVLGLNVAESDPEEVFSGLLWMGQTEVMLRHHDQVTVQTLEDNPFHQQYVRLLNELNNAPAETQLRYVRMFNRQSIMNQDRLAAEYQNILASHPNAEDAKNALEQTDTFRHAQAFDMMCRSMGGPVGFLLRQSSQADPGNPDAALDHIADRRPEVNALLQSPMSQENTAAQGQRSLADAAGSYLDAPLVADAYNLLTRIRDDKDERSDSCSAMYRMVGMFSRDDHGNIKDETKYLKHLTACERAARLYLKTHHRKPATKVGKERVQLAKDILTFCQNARDAYDEKMQNRDRAERDALAAKKDKSLDELERLSRLQKYASAAGINPKLRDMNPPDRWYAKTWRWVRHAFTSILTGIGHVTTGAVGNTLGVLVAGYAYGIKNPIIRFRNGGPKSLDLTTVPGERDENLRETYHNEVDPKTGILTDVRRVPMLWEQELPDDPSQPPTISFRIAQPELGSAIGETDSDMGHSFLCLKYSKVNPHTGKLQRYETSFGFYPKGGFMSSGIKLAQLQVGTKVPGQLGCDLAHNYSVERTVKADSKKINKLILMAQNYEKGGYNLFSRNCTTFVADCAKAAGVDLNLRKVDLTTSDSLTMFGTVIGPMSGTGLLASNMNRHFINRSGRNDYSFQRFGQKMVSKEDYERETVASMNQRMRGYAPGAAGQAIRADPRFVIRNQDKHLEEEAMIKARQAITVWLNHKEEYRQYVEKYNMGNYTSVNDFIKNNYTMASIISLKKQVYQFTTGMEAIVRNRITDRDAFTNTVSALSKYCDTTIEAIRQAASLAEKGGPDAKENAARGSRLAKEFIETMDRYFRVSFQSDNDLAKGFQQLAAVASGIQNGINGTYRSLLREEIAKSSIRKDDPAEMRDTAAIVNSFLADEQIQVSPKGQSRLETTQSLPGLLGVCRVYKDAREYIKDVNAVSRSKAGHATDGEKAREKTAKLRTALVASFALSYRNFTTQTKFSNSDLNLLFNTMPAMRKYEDKASVGDTTRKLQCLALEHIFGGLRPSLGPDLEDRILRTQNARKLDPQIAELENRLKEYKKQLKTLPKNSEARAQMIAEAKEATTQFKQLKSTRQEQHRSDCQQFYDDAGTRLTTALNEKLRSLSEDQMSYLRSMQICIALRKYQEDLKTTPNLAPDNKNYAQLAANELMDTLVTTYCGNLITGAVMHMSGKDKEKTPSLQGGLNTADMLRELKVPDFLKTPINGLNKKGAALNQNPQQPAPAHQAPNGPAAQ